MTIIRNHFIVEITIFKGLGDFLQLICEMKMVRIGIKVFLYTELGVFSCAIFKHITVKQIKLIILQD